MKTIINVDNYEEIMFRLVEDDFDKPTRTDLLKQIEADELFKFEWESWQKTKFIDPLENYDNESDKLAAKILLIAEPQVSDRKRIYFYWSAAASVLLLVGTLFFLAIDFTSSPKQAVPEIASKPATHVSNAFIQVKKAPLTKPVTLLRKSRNQKIVNQAIPDATDSITILSTKNTLAEISKIIDSVPVKLDEIVKASEKKPRFKITVETFDISGTDPQNYVMAQREKVKMNKVFTNTKMFLSRKPNGEPDRLILIGDDNSFICLNLNY